MKVSEFAKTYGGKADAQFSITITFVDPEKWARWAALEESFMPQYKKLFKDCVFETHKYLIRVTPLITGRLRAGWTGILNKYNIDYTAAFMDTALLDRVHPELNQSAISEGMALCQYMDADFDVTVINSVPYAEYVEFGTSVLEGQNFTNKARYKGEYIAAKAFDDWFKKCSQKADIVPPDPVEEVLA